EIVKVFPLLDPSDGSLNLIYKKFRLTTPTYAKRKVNILRACKHVHEGALAVVEVSFKRDQVENECESNCHRFASGCLIEDLNNGGSWVWKF
ncbi:homeobox-leucine zipper protein HDG11-like protein, partial [Tanacetum coccineum]